jgi:molybdopterin molybdotransferase
MVCALLFLKPMISKLLGSSEPPLRFVDAKLAHPLPANDKRQDYMRCHLRGEADGSLVAEPFPLQDSSMMRLYAHADGLIVRPPNDAARVTGDSVAVLPLD